MSEYTWAVGYHAWLENKELRADNERLRAALRRIVQHDPAKPGLGYDNPTQLVESMLSEARHALEGKQ